MTIKFNLTGAKRKALVKAMSEILSVDAKYLGMPTMAYEVDYFTVDKEGKLSFSDNADSEEVEYLLEKLEEKGFTAQEEKSEQSENVGLTVAIPLDCVSLGKLSNLLDAKGSLIKKALGIDDTPIVLGEYDVSFPWFTKTPDSESAKAYTHFISALCQMTKEQKRINSSEKKVKNEKYAFRCFLLRLGFIGKEYKSERKILLKNLKGSAAFRDGGNKNVKHAVSE